MKLLDFIITKSGEDSINDKAIYLKNNKASVTLTCPPAYQLAKFKRVDIVTNIPNLVAAGVGAQNSQATKSSELVLSIGQQKTITVLETDPTWNTGGTHVDILITIVEATVGGTQEEPQHIEYVGGGGGGGDSNKPTGNLDWVPIVVTLIIVGVAVYLAYREGWFHKMAGALNGISD